MGIKRRWEMSPLEQAIIKMIFSDAIKYPHDGTWYKYKRGFTFEDVNYEVKCRFNYDGVHLTYKDMIITRETQTIMLDPKDYH